jgi:hypothetical protein
VNQRSRSESVFDLLRRFWPVWKAIRSAMQPLDVEHLLGLDGDVGRLARRPHRAAGAS